MLQLGRGGKRSPGVGWVGSETGGVMGLDMYMSSSSDTGASSQGG
jgi:hypothetical protein